MNMIIGVSGKKQSGKSTLVNYLTTFKWVKYSNNSAYYEKYYLKQDNNGFITVLKNENNGIKRLIKQEDLVKYIEEDNFYPIRIKIYSFADSLKRFCVDVLGLREEQCYGTDRDKNTLTKYKWNKFPTLIKRKYKNYKSIYMSAREIMQIMGTDIGRNMFDENIWVNTTIRLINKEKPDIAFISDVRFPTEVQAVCDNNGYIIRLTRETCNDEHASEIALDDYSWDSYPEKIFLLDNDKIDIQEKNKIAVDIFDGIENF